MLSSPQGVGDETRLSAAPWSRNRCVAVHQLLLLMTGHCFQGIGGIAAQVELPSSSSLRPVVRPMTFGNLLGIMVL
eukprot:s1449_g9.t1